ncbi:hypothetical protein Poly51_55660 [Rubripirellula tenax]|uniref:Uncharacterized protein n=1 Tax=Rubripirellula tenax TaxID=2528015 RepID=A0A5C6EEL3_9BACT|nr:hypothetical protein [Rubripirellula tenax]TWU46171.1 hypothetical protein Poly51_55660 [Rubripirellula tenax]
MNYKRRLLAIFIAASMATGNSLQAGTVNWDGLGDGTTYEDGGNWGGTAPANDLVTDTATFTGGTVDLSTTRQVGGIDFSSPSTLSGIGSIEIGSGGIAVGGNSAIGTSAVFNQTNTWDAPNSCTRRYERLGWGIGIGDSQCCWSEAVGRTEAALRIANWLIKCLG